MPIDTKDKTADLVADWMHDNARAMSIDSLLTWPDQAMEMGRWVCSRLGRKATAANVHEICRVALNARKRGDLRLDRV